MCIRAWLGLAGGINTYAYVDGNSVSRADPFGLACPADLKASGRCIEAANYDPCKDGKGNTRGGFDRTVMNNRKAVNLFSDREVAGRVKKDGTFETVRSTYKYTPDGIKTTAFYPADGNTDSIVHSHPYGDDWSNIPGPEDDGAVNGGAANYIVQNDSVGVIELADGQYQYRTVIGNKMKGSNKRKTQERLDLYRDWARAKSNCTCN